MTAWRPLPLMVGRPEALLAVAGPDPAMKELPVRYVIGAAALLAGSEGYCTAPTSCSPLRALSSTSS